MYSAYSSLVQQIWGQVKQLHTAPLTRQFFHRPHFIHF